MHNNTTRILQSAEGYLELGMLNHASLELEKAPVEPPKSCSAIPPR
jgi:hypothetical protein